MSIRRSLHTSAALAGLLCAHAAMATPVIVSISHSGSVPGTPTVTGQIQCISNNVQLTAYYQRMNAAGIWGPTQFLGQFWCKPPANTNGIITVPKSITLNVTPPVQSGEKFRFRVQQGGSLSSWVVHQF